MLLKKLFIQSFIQNWLTILGSFILILSWYSEKVLVSNYSDKIQESERKELMYRVLQTQFASLRYHSQLSIEEINRIGKSQVEIDTSLAIGNFVAESKVILNLLALGLLIDEEDDSKIIEYHRQVGQWNTLIDKLAETNDLWGLLTNLNTFRQNLRQFSIDDQTNMLAYIRHLQKNISKTQAYSLIFYAIGILLITMNRVKDTLQNKSNEFKLKRKFKKEQRHDD
jgi:hypothetical protein